MNTELYDYIMNHPLFSHHDHHFPFSEFERDRTQFDAASLFAYAFDDVMNAAHKRERDQPPKTLEQKLAYWPIVAVTGYGQAARLGWEALFDLDVSIENIPIVTEKLQTMFRDRSALEVYDLVVREKANIKWVINDIIHRSEATIAGDAQLLQGNMYPDYYRFTWRWDGLFCLTDTSPMKLLSEQTGISVLSLDRLVKAMNANIDQFKKTGNLAAFKLGFAYYRDLNIGHPTKHEAERAFNAIWNQKATRNGHRQNTGIVNASEARPLADYLIHQLLERAHDEDIPIQIHTGTMNESWQPLTNGKVMDLIPIFDRYRDVRFDVFHASWPWTSEMTAIAKNYPNVYPDMCWTWAINPSESERILSEWLDCIPYNKIFAFGADTLTPWCDIGFAVQTRMGIARVLEEKVRKGFFSTATAKEVASAIMLTNGEQFHGLY